MTNETKRVGVEIARLDARALSMMLRSIEHALSSDETRSLGLQFDAEDAPAGKLSIICCDGHRMASATATGLEPCSPPVWAQSFALDCMTGRQAVADVASLIGKIPMLWKAAWELDDDDTRSRKRMKVRTLAPRPAVLRVYPAAEVSGDLELGIEIDGVEARYPSITSLRDGVQPAQPAAWRWIQPAFQIEGARHNIVSMFPRYLVEAAEGAQIMMRPCNTEALRLLTRGELDPVTIVAQTDAGFAGERLHYEATVMPMKP